MGNNIKDGAGQDLAKEKAQTSLEAFCNDLEYQLARLSMITSKYEYILDKLEPQVRKGDKGSADLVIEPKGYLQNIRLLMDRFEYLIVTNEEITKSLKSHI